MNSTSVDVFNTNKSLIWRHKVWLFYYMLHCPHSLIKNIILNYVNGQVMVVILMPLIEYRTLSNRKFKGRIKNHNMNERMRPVKHEITYEQMLFKHVLKNSDCVSTFCIFKLNFYLYYKLLHLYYPYTYIYEHFLWP
jgi:hypothetical protein